MPWRRNKIQRWVYGINYALFSVAGVFAFFFPSQALENALQSFLVFVWAGFLVAGGLASLYSPLRNTWKGEMVGLPLLITSSWIFGIALLGYATTPAAFAIAYIFCGIGCGFLGRWLDIRRFAVISQEVGRDGAG